MRTAFTVLLISGVLAGASAPEAILREMIAEVAVAQLSQIDPAWQPEQRDCAGLVRFAYGRAFTRLRPERMARGLWRDDQGRPSAFADAENLLRHSFRWLGRDAAAVAALQSGDLLAFRRPADDGAGAVYHLMLVVRTGGAGGGEALVVYHTGDPERGLTGGRLRALRDEAPREWQPLADNPLFLGGYRFEEWSQ